MASRHGLRVDLSLDPDADPGSPVIASILFRSARELLFNVVKHSGTNTARISTRVEGARLQLCVADAGRGFDPAGLKQIWRRNAGFGLFSIEDRIRMLGGSVAIDGAPGIGCAVFLTVPSHSAATPEE
jgi:signal transduction histidine kinase